MAQHGYNTILARWSGSAYEDVSEITGLVGPSYSQDTIETSHMATTNEFKTFIGGLKDGGEVTLDCQFDPAGGATQHDDLKTDLEGSAMGLYKITFPDTTTCIFNALVTGWTPTEPLEDKLTLAVTFKVSAKPTWA